MARIKNKKKRFFGPVIILCLITLLIMILSSLFDIIGIEGQKASIVNGVLEMSLITVKNIFTIDGFKYMIGSAVTNFRLLEPLVLLIMSLITASILESSGIIAYAGDKLKKIKPIILTFIVVFIGICLTFLGNYGYIMLLPMVGLLYQYMGKNPVSGILTLFLGITLGYGTGILVNYNTFVMGGITELVASTQVDKNYQFKMLSNLYIMIASTGIISIIMSSVINNTIDKNLPKYVSEEIEEAKLSTKAFVISNIVLFIMLGLVSYMIIPGLPMSGILLDKTQGNYIAMLFSETAPFRDGIIYLALIVSMIYGAIYGKISHNLDNFKEYNIGLSKSFENIGYVFVIMFFASNMIGVLNYTNLGEVIVTNLVSFLSYMPFSGLPLIVVFFVLVIIMTLFIPDTVAKWQLVAPLIVPLFMRANLTPEFTQFIFGVADGIGKALTPIFIYLIIVVGFLQKYSKEDTRVSLFGTFKLLMPTILITALVWILLIIIWYIVGLPLGIGSVVTL